ncbi:glycosyltransferase family 2 protein [Sinorhizobium americanum]|uniref:Glycosyl transferase family 2 n=1 Tax=Sinorhizobium americanum TaxID=194963 RepID=A0A4R2AVV2_9HYPH|nr:glycosyltransferase family 2 protein [Sinorhizobium americanum]TCN17284.1 glycosyl transferase family 2 [Sinorhizobium americanum]
MDRSKLILIPAYNEAGTIAGVVKKAVQYGTVVVVDDRSTDDTARLATEAGALVLTNEKNEGYEGNLNRGFSYAIANDYVTIVTIDADGEHDPSLLELFFDALIENDYPIVLGFRPRKQRFAEIIMGIYCNLVYGVNDILCGMKGYNLSLLKEVSVRAGDKVGTAAATQALRQGISFLQIPVSGVQRTDQPRFGSIYRANLRIIKTLAETVMDDLRYRLSR